MAQEAENVDQPYRGGLEGHAQSSGMFYGNSNLEIESISPEEYAMLEMMEASVEMLRQFGNK